MYFYNANLAKKEIIERLNKFDDYMFITTGSASTKSFMYIVGGANLIIASLKIKSILSYICLIRFAAAESVLICI